MISLCTNTILFVCTYLVLMIPTYVLPYFGSNSALINGVGSLIGRGMTPQWWMHAWSLVMLMVVASVRGKLINKRFLLVFPLVAAAFDMVPGLNWVPMVPTVMHLVAIILGAMGVVAVADVGTHDSQPLPSARGEAWSAGLMTLAVCGGWAMFTINTINATQKFNAERKPLVWPTTPVKPVPSPNPSTAQTPALPEPTTSAARAETQAVVPAPKEHKKVVLPSYSRPVAKSAPESQPKPVAAAPTVRLININD